MHLLLCSAFAAALFTGIFCRRQSDDQHDSVATDVTCEGDDLSISCDSGKRINITFAQYGFDVLIPQKCSSPRLTPADRESDCVSTTSQATVKANCNNKRTCNFIASEDTFGEICPSVGKYLKVHYTCVPKNKMKGAAANTAASNPAIAAAVRSDCNCTTSYLSVNRKHNPEDSSLAFGWIHSLAYIKENEEKLVLYGLLCACVAFISALIVFIARMFYVKYRKAKRSATHHKLNVTESAIQDTSHEENTYIAASDPSDMIQYNLGYRAEATNRLNSGPGSLRGSSSNRVYNNDTPRFNTNSLTVTNHLHGDHRGNLDRSPLTTPSTAMNNSPNAALTDNRNTYYENSADDECTIEDNNMMANHSMVYSAVASGSGYDARPRTNSLFDRHS